MSTGLAMKLGRASCGFDVAFFKIPFAGVAFDMWLLFDLMGWKLDSLDES